MVLGLALWPWDSHCGIGTFAVALDPEKWPWIEKWLGTRTVALDYTVALGPLLWPWIPQSDLPDQSVHQLTCSEKSEKPPHFYRILHVGSSELYTGTVLVQDTREPRSDWIVNRMNSRRPIQGQRRPLLRIHCVHTPRL